MPRKKRSEKSTIKDRIVLALLKGKKSTTQLSEELYGSRAHYDRFSKDLGELREERIINSRKQRKKITPGPKGKIHSLEEDISAFKKVFEFLGSQHAIEFIRSPYARKMINSELLREIERPWGILKPYRSKAVIEKEQADYNIFEERKKADESAKASGKEAPLGIRQKPYWNYGMPNFFTEEEVLEILRLSPTALQKSLEGPGNLKGESAFQEMLLSSLILDFNTYHYPGYEMKPLVKVELYRQGEREPFLDKEAGIPVFHIQWSPQRPPTKEANEISQSARADDVEG